jgi:hypothetical protein
MALPAFAQDYPERPGAPDRGFPAGRRGRHPGPYRRAATHRRIGQQVVVDNRGGAGGLIATEIAVKANPDGYTLLFTSIPHVINPHLYKKVAYDALKDFVPVHAVRLGAADDGLAPRCRRSR